jgi:hypothetical protein
LPVAAAGDEQGGGERKRFGHRAIDSCFVWRFAAKPMARRDPLLSLPALRRPGKGT